MLATSWAVVLGWIVLGPAAALLVTAVAGRFLGARRGWLALAICGVVGWTLGVVCAGAITGWSWSSGAMVLVSLTFGTMLTMAAAVTIDMLSPSGSLAQGEEAGLVTFTNPLHLLRRQLRLARRYWQVLHLAR